VLRVGRQHLLSVDDERVADELRARAQRGEIGAGAGLGVALAPYLLGGEYLRQVALPLLLGAELDQCRPDHLHAHHADERRRAGTDHLLVDDGLAHDVCALAAPLLRPGEREVAGLVDFPLPRLRRRDAARVAVLERPRVALALRDVLLEPRAHLALEGALRGRVAQIHRRLATTSCRG